MPVATSRKIQKLGHHVKNAQLSFSLSRKTPQIACQTLFKKFPNVEPMQRYELYKKSQMNFIKLRNDNIQCVVRQFYNIFPDHIYVYIKKIRKFSGSDAIFRRIVIVIENNYQIFVTVRENFPKKQ